MRVVPIDEDIAMASRTLKFVHEDPADRYIAATAYIAKAPLATVDARLRCLEWLRTLG
jgi:PIN domain nuclease of toxin-antitoxin system